MNSTEICSRDVHRRRLAAFLLAAILAGPASAAEDGPFAAAIEHAQPRTVKIYGAGVSSTIAGYASGVVVSDEGHILTAAGVYLTGRHLRIGLSDGQTYEAEIVRQDRGLQVALLKIDAKTPAYFELADEPVAEKGDWVVTVSNAFKVADGSEPLSVNLGIVSLRTRLDVKRGVQPIEYTGDMILFDAITSNPGAPGGAVVTAEGRLVGMIGRILEGRGTGVRLNYAVPADLLAAFLRGETTSAADASPGAKPYLGIRLFTLGGRRDPAFIDRVAPGSPAAEVGLRPDDLVVSIGGRAVADGADFQRKVAELTVGEPVTLVVKRQGKLVQVQITPVAEEEDE